MDSHHHPLVPMTNALIIKLSREVAELGLEPISYPYERYVLPHKLQCHDKSGSNRTRTYEGVNRLIYSQVH